MKITVNPKKFRCWNFGGTHVVSTVLPYVQGAGSVLDLRGCEGPIRFIDAGDFIDDFDNLSEDLDFLRKDSSFASEFAR